MNLSKLMRNTLVAAFVFMVANFLASPALGQAKISSSKPSEVLTQNKQYSRGSWRGGQRSGGSRTLCDRAVELTALVPEFQDPSQLVSYTGGVTVSEHPTLWFYISEALDDQLVASFSFRDRSGQELYKISSSEFSAAQPTPGVIGISIPSTVTLEPEQLYYWTLQIRCGSGVYYVDGGIERILPDPALVNQLASLSPREQAELYWQNGIWYDALTAIATHLSSTGGATAATAADWQQVLQFIDLSNIPAPGQSN